jgi:uncharacterized membrane protein
MYHLGTGSKASRRIGRTPHLTSHLCATYPNLAAITNKKRCVIIRIIINEKMASLISHRNQAFSLRVLIYGFQSIKEYPLKGCTPIKIVGCYSKIYVTC